MTTFAFPFMTNTLLHLNLMKQFFKLFETFLSMKIILILKLSTYKKRFHPFQSCERVSFDIRKVLHSLLLKFKTALSPKP